jgi:hypothetical protein
MEHGADGETSAPCRFTGHRPILLNPVREGVSRTGYVECCNPVISLRHVFFLLPNQRSRQES